MRTIEVETSIDTQGNIHLPARYDYAYGTRAKVPIWLPEIDDTTKPLTRSHSPVTSPEALLGCVGYRGPAKSLEDMATGVLEEVKRQWQKGD